MKNYFLLLILSMVLFSGCDIFGDNKVYEELRVVNDGQLVLDLSDIDYYDFSSHIFYLKQNNRLAGEIDKLNGAKILANGSEVFPLKIHENYSAQTPSGIFIRRNLDEFGDFAFRMNWMDFMTGSTSSGFHDPRIIDQRMVDVLKKHNKFRAGLEVEIVSVTKQDNEITAKIRLSNLDNESYYHLDPEKMGKGLFHYFTKGLISYDQDLPGYVYNKVAVEAPDPNSNWSEAWLSEIRGNESKTMEFTYPDFDHAPSGQDLRFSFEFPSLERSIQNGNDLHLGNGRIWLGKIRAEKMVVL